MTKQINLQALARATGGVLVTSNSVQIEVRMLDAYHTQHNTSQLKLPLVFKGTLEETRKWAKINGYREVIEPQALFGIHFSDKHDNSYVLT